MISSNDLDLAEASFTSTSATIESSDGLCVELHHVLNALEIIKPSVTEEHEDHYRRVRNFAPNQLIKWSISVDF